MKEVIVHCSDTPNGRYHTAEDIHRWHKEPNKGYDGIGYHYVIRTDGVVDNGRPEYWQGAHCRGHNTKIGICLIGRDRFTEEQEKSLYELLASLGYERAELNETLYSHYELDSGKTCPNFSVRDWFSFSVYAWPTLEVDNG